MPLAVVVEVGLDLLGYEFFLLLHLNLFRYLDLHMGSVAHKNLFLLADRCRWSSCQYRSDRGMLSFSKLQVSRFFTTRCLFCLGNWGEWCEWSDRCDRCEWRKRGHRCNRGNRCDRCHWCEWDNWRHRRKRCDGCHRFNWRYRCHRRYR